MDAAFLKNISILTAPARKFWIKTQARIDAARALGASKKEEAVIPLLEALKVPKVCEEALSALERLNIPRAGPSTLRALKTTLAAYVENYFQEYFHPTRNPNFKKLGLHAYGPEIQKEPESFLGASLSILQQLSREMGEAVAQCEREGLQPYSREKFRDNIRLLDHHGVMMMWPELEAIDRKILRLELVFLRLTAKEEPVEATPEPAPVRAEEEMPEAAQDPLDPFIQQAKEKEASITVPARDIFRLAERILLEVRQDFPTLGPMEINRLLASSIHLKCQWCGHLSAQYIQQVLKAVERAHEEGVPLHSLDTDQHCAGAYAVGHGPDCPGSLVDVVFNMAHMYTNG